MTSKHKQRTRIVQLKAGEAVPAGEPARYKSQSGYVRLRWKVGVYQYVEVYEHRLVAGLVAPHVHHKNKQKDDNRPENLAGMSVREHHGKHSRVNFEEAAALYRSGYSLKQLSAKYGVDYVSIMRSLKLRGVAMRTLSESWKFRRSA